MGYFGGGGGGGADPTSDNAWTGTNSFIDTKFSILDDGDNTKVLQFQGSGISAGTTRTLSSPNFSGTIVGSPVAPTQVAASTAGTATTLTASAATAGASVAGAAAGGAVTITSGSAARLTSGNAVGGDINLIAGSGIGTGLGGAAKVVGEGRAWTAGINGAALEVSSGLYGSANGLYLGETTLNRPTIGPGPGGSYMQIVSGTTAVLFTNNALGAFLGNWDNGGNLFIGGATTATAALEIDNNAVAKPILDCKDNGTSTFKIADGGDIQIRRTITAGGTTGDQTINKLAGTVNIAAAQAAIVVTNSFVTTSSIVFATIRTNDATAGIKNVVPGAGSFTINLSAAATAETSIGFLVTN